MPPVEAQAPMAMHHLGSGIWSQIRRTANAILYVTVPATIMQSAWRGEKRITSDPKREISKRLAPTAINSIAQQAKPIGIGHTEFLRNQFNAASTVVTTTSPSIFEL